LSGGGPLAVGRMLLRTVVRCSLWVVGKSGKRPREISRVRCAHERARIFGAHKCHPVVLLYCHPGPRSGITSSEPPVAFGGQYHFVAPVRLRRASSASRAKNQEPGRGASERGTALPLSKDGSTILDEGPRTALHLFMLSAEVNG
jgi:hypothetical protein